MFRGLLIVRRILQRLAGRRAELSFGLRVGWGVGLVLVAATTGAVGETEAERGYRLLRSKAYLPADFDQETWSQLWTVWEEPLREKARLADAATRRQMAYDRYAG